MAGKLFIVGTPIGNMGDMSPRAVQTLREVDFVAAEDTRVTRGLLSRFDIHRPMVSYYEHNKLQSGEAILARLQNGESCALCSDAGMPGVSDPGGALVAACAEAGVEVDVIPGPCALICAVAHSALPVGRFCFEGFLSVSKKSRREHLEAIKTETRVMVFYEAPHKLLYTLEDLLSVLGERGLTVCRELTKLHQEIRHTTLSGALEHFRAVSPRGEFVLIIEGAKPPVKEPDDIEAAFEKAKKLVEQGCGVKEAASAVGIGGAGKKEIYRRLSRGE